MKKLLFSITLLAFAFVSNAQQILCQDFTNSTTGWVTAQGSSITLYENFYNNCVVEYGIVTPGVGGNNPAKILSEVIIPNQQLVEVKFNIDRYDANLKCSSHANFGCQTNVDILAVASAYNGTDPIGDGAVIYSNNSNYALPIAGGTVSLIITLPASLPSFKIYFNFTSPVQNCNQTGTKYVMDKFCFTGYSNQCLINNTCPPVAGNDYFNSGTQGFASSTLLGDVYGTNLAYNPPAPHTAYVTRSLGNLALTENGGKDYDIDNHPITAMTFALTSQSFAPADATLVFNSDGTFSFTRINTNINQFFFYYTITDPTSLSDPAGVRIDFSNGAPLPVKLVNFKAAKTNTGALLSWETAQESNNKGFEILRKTSGNFEQIGFVDSKAPGGYSTEKLAYTFDDRNMPKEKIVYYKLAQVDIDGKQFHSDIKIINNGDSKLPILVYPNPSRGNLQITLPADITGLTDIKIYNATGSLIQSLKNNTEKQIFIKGLQPGIYMVKVIMQTDNTVYTNRLIVQ